MPTHEIANFDPIALTALDAPSLVDSHADETLVRLLRLELLAGQLTPTLPVDPSHMINSERFIPRKRSQYTRTLSENREVQSSSNLRDSADHSD